MKNDKWRCGSKNNGRKARDVALVTEEKINKWK